MRFFIAAFALLAVLNIPNMLSAFGEHMIYEDEIVVASYVQVVDGFPPVCGAPSDEDVQQAAEASLDHFGEGQLSIMRDMRLSFLELRLEQATQMAASRSCFDS